jgi:hypothetical protein
MTLAAGLLLLVASDSGQVSAKPIAQTPQAEGCREPDGWDAVAQRNPRYIVFGELHGTQQAPTFVGNLACALASKGERTLLALEKDATDDAALQAAWTLPSNQFDKALANIGWAGRQDGVASQAMFAMLVDMHDLKEKGLPIGVVAFNGARDAAQARRFADLAGQGPHEAAQAENIAQAAERGNYDRTLVLVGNFHAGKQRVNWDGMQFDPMAARLSAYGNTLTLNMHYAAGTSWACIRKTASVASGEKPSTEDAPTCGLHPMRGNADLNRSPFIAVTPATEGDPTLDYDGFFWVGAITGSPPLAAE